MGRQTKLSRPFRYDENFRCPKCNNELSALFRKKRICFRCKNCRFEVCPDLDEISSDFVESFFKDLQSIQVKKIEAVKKQIRDEAE